MSRDSAASFSASEKPVSMSRLSAFIASGRLRVSFITPSSTDFSRSGIVSSGIADRVCCGECSAIHSVAQRYSVLLSGTLAGGKLTDEIPDLADRIGRGRDD